MQRPKKIIQLGEYDQRFEILDEDLLWQVYEGDNYKIIDTPRGGKEKTAVIYFSSNGLYDTKQKQFNLRVVEQDRYEWQKNRIKEADRHIFVRDIWQMSYYHGINDRVDSMDKLIAFLKEKTTGYRLITLGSSGGGYAAALVGSLLKAERIMSFSGQFDIIGFANACSGKDPVFWNRDPEKEKYLQIESIVKKSGIPLYYFVGAHNKFDSNDLRVAESMENVRVFKLDNEKHGMPIDRHYLRELINFCGQDLERLHSKFDGRLIQNVQIGWALKGWKYIPAMIANSGKAIERKLRKLRKSVYTKKRERR